MACHHRLRAVHTVERHWAWHAIIAHGRQAQSNDVRCDIPSPPLDNTYGRTTSGVPYIIAFGPADTVGRRKAWHSIITLGWETRSNDVERGMPSPPWDSTHSQTTSGVACYHRLLAAQTVIRCRPWHAITAFGLHTWSDDVGRSIPSLPLESTHGR